MRQRNEDVGAIVSVRFAGAPSRDYDIGLVCDGIGGMVGGREAALTAASSFIGRLISEDQRQPPSIRITLAVEAAQYAVYELLKGRGGTTLSAVLVGRSPDAWVAHVGDSRIVTVSSSDRSIQQVTRDDTIKAALKLEGRGGELDRLIQFIGMDDEVLPQIDRVEVDNFSGFLITSDGAHLAPRETSELVVKYATSSGELVRRLLNLADAIGGHDNATAVYLPPKINNVELERNPAGMSVALTSVAGALEIWNLTVPDYEYRARSHSTGQRQGLSEQPPMPSDEKAKGGSKSTSAKRKRTQRRKEQPAAPHLPLEESAGPAKLEFSDNDEG